VIIVKGEDHVRLDVRDKGEHTFRKVQRDGILKGRLRGMSSLTRNGLGAGADFCGGSMDVV